MVYDDIKGWTVESSNGRVVKSIKQRRIDELASQATKGDAEHILEYSFSELYIDVWTLCVLGGCVAILIVFFIRNDLSTHVALLMCYLFALLTFILSNGMLLYARTTKANCHSHDD